MKGKRTMDNGNMNNNNDRGQYSRPFPGNEQANKQANQQAAQNNPLPEQSAFYQRYQNYSPNQPSNVKEFKQFNVWGLIGMITGILSLIACCIHIYVALGMGIFAIICFILSRKVGNSGMAIAGLVCGIITVILCAASLVILLIFKNMLSEMGVSMSQAQNWTAQDWQRFLEAYQNK